MFKGSSNGGYKYKDEFYTDLTAGNVHGTDCEEGPGTRHVVDTDSKMTITNGKLSMAPHSTPAYGEPLFAIDEAVTRAAGVMLKGQINITDATKTVLFGFDDDKTGLLNKSGFSNVSDLLRPRIGSSTLGGVFTTLDATDYEWLVSLKSAGAALFIKDSGTWKFLGNWGSDATATLYAGISNYNTTLTSDYLRIPETLWLPVPLASDGFNRSDGAIGDTDGEGHAETSGLGSGGDGLTWTGATWTIDTNKAKNTPTKGSDVIVNGTFGADTDWTKGTGWTIAAGVADCDGTQADFTDLLQTVAPLTATTWYVTSYDVTRTAGGVYTRVGGVSGILRGADGSYTETGRAITASFAMRGTTPFVGTVDNIITEPLTLSTLFSSLTLSTQDVVATCSATIVAGTQAGMVMNLDSASNPQNFIVIYHNGSSLIAEKCVAGTYTTLISAAATYDATAEIKAHKDGTSLEIFYDDVKIGSTTTISDAGIVDNLLHGLFSTYSGNRIDGFNIYARGTQNQHVVLDRF